jgi:lipopolysaccharide transport protein LptA
MTDMPAEQPAAAVQAVTPEPQDAETAAGKMPAPPVTAASPVTETVTGKASILPATAPTDTPVTNAEAKVEKPLPKKPKEKKLTGRPAKITSDTTVYNRKEGIASFEGHVHVDDEQYQMHADRVFLFFEVDADATNGVRRAKGTNDVSRAAGDVRNVVAIGHVAMTNDAHRAYGAKVKYSKQNGCVTLYSGDGITAEVRDESKEQPQIVRGKRIRFWIDSEQVEVDEADLTGAAPSGGAASLKKALGK